MGPCLQMTSKFISRVVCCHQFKWASPLTEQDFSVFYLLLPHLRVLSLLPEEKLCFLQGRWDMLGRWIYRGSGVQSLAICLTSFTLYLETSVFVRIFLHGSSGDQALGLRGVHEGIQLLNEIKEGHH